MRYVIRILAVILLAGNICLSWALNWNAAAKSALVPGMGQMSGGQKWIGLGFMIPEMTCIHLMFNSVAKANTYARDTYLLDQKYGEVKTYEEKWDIWDQWNKRVSDISKEKKSITLYGAVAAGIWGINVAHALIFTPKPAEDVSQQNEKAAPMLSLEYKNERAGLLLTKKF